MGITPDTKDWTWVLNEPCDECGFVAQDLTPQSLAATVRDMIPLGSSFATPHGGCPAE